MMKKFILSDETFIRYSEQGEGPPLLLLHTIRTRIEYFDKILPYLTKKYKVFVIDLPGHGDSTINKNTNYSLEFITNSIIEFIKYKNISNLTLAGESIGAVLSVTIAKKIPEKIKKIFSFNPYDYDKKFAEGVSRGNFISNFLFFHIRLPFGLGFFFSKLECYPILLMIIKGGVFKKNIITHNFISLLCNSIKKKEFTYHERNIFFNFILSFRHEDIYKDLKTPISLTYSDNDWSYTNERERTKNALLLRSFNTIKNTGHFSFLESPDKVSEIINNFKI